MTDFFWHGFHGLRCFWFAKGLDPLESQSGLGSGFPYCRYWVLGLRILLFFGTDFTDYAVFVFVFKLIDQASLLKSLPDFGHLLLSCNLSEILSRVATHPAGTDGVVLS